MSKQSEAKAKQGYVPKAVPQTCGNCGHFQFETVHHQGRNSWCGPYDSQHNLRCGLGGFKVMKMGTCDEFRGKPDQPEDIKPLGPVIP